ncbi:MAG: cell division protein FtsQ [Tateyamaria sp.]|nr:cell division protein FtsQ [Tateyamaria sp.]
MPSLKNQARIDPAPSRWSWRFQRLMLTPAFLFGLRIGVPFVVTLVIGAWCISNPETRAVIAKAVMQARESIEQRPEFMVNLMAIDGGDTDLSEAIRSSVSLNFPVSSFELVPSEVRDKLLKLNQIKEVSVRIRPGGILQVDVVPRIPVAIWRTADGLILIDNEGKTISPVSLRSMYPELPVIAGEGAPKHINEALKLISAATPLGDRLRGLVRLGNRRWDVVLDRNQRILLPTKGAVRALERVIFLETTPTRQVLSRDIARIDLRLHGRPTVQMNAAANEEWRRIRQLNTKKELQ